MQDIKSKRLSNFIQTTYICDVQINQRLADEIGKFQKAESTEEKIKHANASLKILREVEHELTMAQASLRSHVEFLLFEDHQEFGYWPTESK